jgi:formylglycine-generating enzyme required for sulfatase activity
MTANAARGFRIALALAIASGALVAGCSTQAPPRSEWKVYLATDAPVPQFGDEVVVDILDGSPLPPERFLDASSANRWPISFGVAPTDPHVPVRIRVRLFRLAITGSDGLPASSSLIDATASLPSPDDGLTTVALTLSMRCFGLPADVAGQRTCDPTTGDLAAEPTLAPSPDLAGLPSPGSWAPAAKVDCRGTVPAGMICVPGGAFLLGSAHHPPIATQRNPVPEHVVQLAPFALDADEFTVGSVRDLVFHHNLPPPLARDPNFDSDNGPCTFISSTDSTNDAMPANCVTWSIADAACKMLGKRLPTEAEWEFAARNLTEETSYPWGSDPNSCAYATVGRGRYLRAEATNCETMDNGFSLGPVAGGNPRDRTSLGVANLGGNVAEWAQDFFNAYSAPCWNPPGSRVLVDPMCGDDTMGGQRSLRGGSWDQIPGSSLGYIRQFSLGSVGYFAVGFRCAVSM